jgi:hypothetical protein
LKNIDNIEDWYRDELNNYNVEPDSNGWDSLAEDLDASTPLTDNNISEWYKKEVSKLEERPDFAVWDKLATNLDTASVWDKLATSLTRYELLLWWKNMAFKGAAVLLLLLGSYFTYSNFNNETFLSENPKTIINKDLHYGFASLLGAENNSEKLHSSIYKSNTTTNGIENSNSVATKKLSQPNEIAYAINSAKENITFAITGNKKEEKLYASVKEMNHYNSIAIKNLNALKQNTERNVFTTTNLSSISEKDILPNYASSEFLVKKEKNKILFNKRRFSSHSSYGIQSKRLYIGANMGFKKQAMITKLKESSPLKAYNQKALLDFGTNFGGVLGIVISDKFNIETNISVNSTSGYKRAFSAEGIAFNENLNLNYTSVNLLAKKMSSRSTFDNRIYSTNFIGGAYVSYLRTATSDINGVSSNLEAFNNTDYGIVLGIEQDRYISKTLVITPGIRYNQGLSNIVNENNSFETARNFSLEFNLGVKYIFTK